MPDPLLPTADLAIIAWIFIAGWPRCVSLYCHIQVSLIDMMSAGFWLALPRSVVAVSEDLNHRGPIDYPSLFDL
jgi:hypothetical protein